MATLMKQKRGFAADWIAANPVLADGELGVEKDTGIIKIGDGVNPWTSLPVAFGSTYLPILGKATDSDKLDGLNSTDFVKQTDLKSAATADSPVKRDGSGIAYFSEVRITSESDPASAARKTYVDAIRREVGRSVTSDYTLVLTDEGKWVWVSSTTAVAFTIPNDATTNFPVGGWFDLTQWGAGALTVVAATGVTLVASGRSAIAQSFKFPGRYSTFRFAKTGANQWYMYELMDGGGDCFYQPTSGVLVTIPSTANVFIPFGTAVETHPDITQSADKTNFTLNRTGVWAISAGWRANTASTPNQRYVFNIGDATATNIYCQVDGMNAAAPMDLSGSITRRFAAGTTLSVVVYTNGSTTTLDTGAGNQRNYFSAAFVRP